MKKIQELKLKLKEMAIDIRNNRTELREKQSIASGIYNEEGIPNMAEHIKTWGTLAMRQSTLVDMKYEYRHHHIAYCELRGKTRDQIEKSKKLACEHYINTLKTKYALEIEEIIK